MAEKLLARRVPSRADYFEWSIPSANSEHIYQGSLQELAEAAKEASVILLLPAAEILHLEISLPIKSKSQLKKALPYAIEDLLAQEVENYHLAWSKQQGDKIAVAAIAREKLQSYQDQCQQAAINLAGIYSEMLFVPYQPESVSIVVEQERAIVRFGQWQGGGIDADSLKLLLEKTRTELNPLQSLQIWHTEACTHLFKPESVQLNSEIIPSILSFYSSNVPPRQELNLLSDSYRSKHSDENHWRVWLPAIALVLLAVVLQFGLVLNNYWKSKTELARVETANQQIFRQTFPHLKRIVNIKAQAEQELVALRKATGNAHHNGYLYLLYKTGEALTNVGQGQFLQLQSLDFTNGILNLQLTGTDMAQLDAFKQLAEQGDSIKANILSAESGEKGLLTRIEIRGPSS